MFVAQVAVVLGGAAMSWVFLTWRLARWEPRRHLALNALIAAGAVMVLLLLEVVLIGVGMTSGL